MRRRGWQALKTQTRVALGFVLMVLVCAGCGRKLPPLPPGEPDPVEIVSIRFVDDVVVVEARCNAAGAVVVLLGKAKGICPACTDDLRKKDELSLGEPGVLVLKDTAPDDDYMVYRLAFEKGTTAWMTPARIVRR